MRHGTSLTEIASTNGKPFLVVVHDVCPVFRSELAEIVGALNPLIGRNISAAVVPNWHGCAINDREFCERVTDHFDEILLHGWTHLREQGGGAISFVTQRSDEFAGMSEADACQRLKQGQDRLSNLFDRQVCGFVPPAWRRGAIDRELLIQAGFEYLMGYRILEWIDGRSIPLSTLTWDVGRFATLGTAAEWIGRLLNRWTPSSLTCLAIHPVDVPRGYLPRIVRIVEGYLDAGGIPVLSGDLHKPLVKEAFA